MTRLYSSISVETTLASTLSNNATSMSVAAGTGTALLGGITLPVGNVDQFTVAIDPDTANEEIVFITGSATDTFTIVRNRAGTSGVQHTAGATVKHVLTSDDLTYFNTGVDNAVTLTGAQSISGIKTFSAAPVISTITNTGTLTLPTSTDTIVARATIDTLTNKSIATTKEITTVSAIAATGTINFDAVTQGILYYTTAATANWTINVRGNSGTTLNTFMNTNDSLTIAFLATQGGTAYYNSAFTIDGTSVTPKWQGGSAPGAGNASGIDAYVYTIIKTASATFTVFASITRFA